MTLNEYQKSALETADYPLKGNNLLYPAMGLAGEAGEALDKVKKLWRNSGITGFSNPLLTSTMRIELAKEVSDVLWYVAALADELHITLDEVAVLNLEKLQDRKLRGVIKSEGDNR